MIQNGNQGDQKVPAQMSRNYELYIIKGGQSKKTLSKLRELKSEAIGSLVTVKAQVIRTSDVKPQIVV